MTFAEMKLEYNARYNNDAYADDPATQTMLGMFDRAETMTDAAKTEFVAAFNYEFALDGELYLGGKRTAAYRYPHLLTEARTVGIKVVTG